MSVSEDIENECRDEILKQGGGLSHHHGVGKLKKHLMSRILPPMALELQQNIKTSLDPKNIFASNNTIYRSAAEE